MPEQVATGINEGVVQRMRERTSETRMAGVAQFQEAMAGRRQTQALGAQREMQTAQQVHERETQGRELAGRELDRQLMERQTKLQITSQQELQAMQQQFEEMMDGRREKNLREVATRAFEFERDMKLVDLDMTKAGLRMTAELGTRALAAQDFQARQTINYLKLRDEVDRREATYDRYREEVRGLWSTVPDPSLATEAERVGGMEAAYMKGVEGVLNSIGSGYGLTYRQMTPEVIRQKLASRELDGAVVERLLQSMKANQELIAQDVRLPTLVPVTQREYERDPKIRAYIEENFGGDVGAYNVNAAQRAGTFFRGVKGRAVVDLQHKIDGILGLANGQDEVARALRPFCSAYFRQGPGDVVREADEQGVSPDSLFGNFSYEDFLGDYEEALNRATQRLRGMRW